MKKQYTAKEDAQKVLQWTKEKLEADFPYEANIAQPTPWGKQGNLVKAFKIGSFLPTTALGWIFNLGMTVLTLGAWLGIWLCWIIIIMGEEKEVVSVTTEERYDGSVLVTVESNVDEWFEVVDSWMTERYTIVNQGEVTM